MSVSLGDKVVAIVLTMIVVWITDVLPTLIKIKYDTLLYLD